MFALLRRSALSSIPPSRRLASTIANGGTEDIMQDALSALGTIATGNRDGFKDVLSPASSLVVARPIESTQLSSRHIQIPPPEDPLLNYMTSIIMRHGERKKAVRVVTRALHYIQIFTRSPPLPLIREAIIRVAPAVRNMTTQLSNKQLITPTPLSERQRTFYAIKWILKASHKRQGQKLELRLAREIIGVLQGDGEALARKAEAHRIAMVNR